MSVTSLWGQLKVAAGSGVLNGGFAFARNMYFVGDNASPFVQTEDTIASAITAAVSGDIIILGPQIYQEGNLVIPVGKDNITIIGSSNLMSSSIEPINSGDEGIQILGNDCTLVNVAITKGTTADYALGVGSQTVSPARFRAVNCKFTGVGGAAVLLDGPTDTLLQECQISDCDSGVLVDTNDNGNTNQLNIIDCQFNNFTTVGLGANGSGLVTGLMVAKCLFGQQDDGTAPTDFIVLSSTANKGMITQNYFATATSDAALLTIGSGILWVANATEAGISTARPA